MKTKRLRIEVAAIILFVLKSFRYQVRLRSQSYSVDTGVGSGQASHLRTDSNFGWTIEHDRPEFRNLETG